MYLLIHIFRGQGFWTLFIMDAITKFFGILESINPDTGFMQVANLFNSINQMSITELLVFWRTLKHFEAIQNNSSNPQLINLKKATIVAIEKAYSPYSGKIRVPGSMITNIYNEITSTLHGEDKILFGRSLF